MKLSIQQVVKDESAQVLFKVRIKTLARKLGFDTLSVENMLIVASEMLSNQIKYSNKTGMVQLWYNDGRFNDEIKNKAEPVTIDIFAMDYGPGIDDIKMAQKDGFTTSKTMGKGLGSIQRMADDYDLYSLKDNKNWHGVAIWGRFYLNKNERPANYQLGQFQRAYHDIAHNGDDIWLNVNKHRVSWLHLDGTGHGEEAYNIVKKVRQVKTDIHGESTRQMLDITARALTDTPGAAGAALKFNISTRQIEYSAVGDMRMTIIHNNQLTDLEVSSGVLGDVSRSYNSQSVTSGSHELFISASDGIRRNWKLEDFPGLWEKHPQLVCFLLGNRKGRNSDDQSMIALKPLN